MDITLPILILAIPITMFLVLGIGGVKMSHKMAGFLGIIEWALPPHLPTLWRSPIFQWRPVVHNRRRASAVSGV